MIPIFKSTKQALAYGKLVGGDKEKINEMTNERTSLRKQVKILQDYDKDYQKMADLIWQSQFVREALEEASLDKYKLKGTK